MAIEKQQPIESHKSHGGEHAHLTHALDEINKQRTTERAQRDPGSGAPNKVDQADTRKKDVAADHLSFSNPFTSNKPETNHTGFPGAGANGADVPSNAKSTQRNGAEAPLIPKAKDVPSPDETPAKKGDGQPKAEAGPHNDRDFFQRNPAAKDVSGSGAPAGPARPEATGSDGVPVGTSEQTSSGSPLGF